MDRTQESLPRRKRAYSNITEQTRMDVVKAIQHDRITILQASQRFQIKPSSVRSILRVFRKEGRLTKKKTRRHRTQIVVGVRVSIKHPNLAVDQLPLVLYTQTDFLNDKTKSTTEEPGIRQLIQEVLEKNFDMMQSQLDKLAKESVLVAGLKQSIEKCNGTLRPPNGIQDYYQTAHELQNRLIMSLLQQRDQQIQLQRLRGLINLLQQQAINQSNFQSIFGLNLFQQLALSQNLQSNLNQSMKVEQC